MLLNCPHAAQIGVNITGLDEQQNTNLGLNHESLKIIYLSNFKACIYLWMMFVPNILFNEPRQANLYFRAFRHDKF